MTNRAVFYNIFLKMYKTKVQLLNLKKIKKTLDSIKGLCYNDEVA